MIDHRGRPWPPRLRVGRIAFAGLICAAVALPLAGRTHGWSYAAAPLVSGVATGLVQARRSGPVVFGAFVLVSCVLAGMAMVVFLFLFLVVGLGA